MESSLSGMKVAILVANGFSQKDMIAAQKALTEAGANVRIVSHEPGLVNGWDGEGWGVSFAIDAPLASALGADYGALVIPGGQRSVDKLKLTAHTKRFISSFMSANKPVVTFDTGINIMAVLDMIAAREVAGSDEAKVVAEQAGAIWMGSGPQQDNNLFSGMSNDENRTSFVNEMLGFMGGYEPSQLDQAA